MSTHRRRQLSAADCRFISLACVLLLGIGAAALRAAGPVRVQSGSANVQGTGAAPASQPSPNIPVPPVNPATPQQRPTIPQPQPQQPPPPTPTDPKTAAAQRVRDARAHAERQRATVGWTGTNDYLVIERPSPDFGWMCWWELNRDRYLEAARKRHGPINLVEAPPEVEAALLDATNDDDARLRGEAALALGRIDSATSVARLKELLNDPADYVRIRAWAAIGLLGDYPDARAILKDAPHQDVIAITGWVLAVGLTREVPGEAWKPLRRLLADVSFPQDPAKRDAYVNYNISEAQRLAVWVLRTRGSHDDRDTLLRVVHEAANPYLVQEAMYGLAAYPDPADLPMADTILQTEHLPAQQAYQQAPPGAQRYLPDISIVSGIFPATAELRGAAANIIRRQPQLTDRALNELRIEALPPDYNALAADDAARFVNSNGQILPTDPNARSTKADWNPVSYSEYFLALGHWGNDLDARFLMDAMQFDYNNGSLQDLPSRGFAALALGEYLHSAEAAAKLHASNDPRVVQSLDTEKLRALWELNKYYVTTYETSDLRGACAMAMALAGADGGTQPYANLIKQPLSALHQRQQPILGYAVTALGLLGDPEALDWASRYLGPTRQTLPVDLLVSGSMDFRDNPKIAPDQRLDVYEVVARRATIDGLAALGDPRALPLVLGEFGKDDAVSLEVARAVAWCRPTVPLMPQNQQKGATGRGTTSRPPPPATRPSHSIGATAAARRVAAQQQQNLDPLAMCDQFGSDLTKMLAARDKNKSLAIVAASCLGTLYDHQGTNEFQSLIADTSMSRVDPQDVAVRVAPRAPSEYMFIPRIRNQFAKPEVCIQSLANPYFYGVVAPTLLSESQTIRWQGVGARYQRQVP